MRGNMSREVYIKDRCFYIKDKPVFINSGEIHYFRIEKKDWEDRIKKAAQAAFIWHGMHQARHHAQPWSRQAMLTAIFTLPGTAAFHGQTPSFANCDPRLMLHYALQNAMYKRILRLRCQINPVSARVASGYVFCTLFRRRSGGHLR